jgi:5-methylcytosine-specific restriction endonuclease McrA
MGLRGRPRKANAQRHESGNVRHLYDEVERQADLAHRVDILRTRLGLGVLSGEEWDLLTTVSGELRRGVISRRRPEPKPARQPREYSKHPVSEYHRGWRAANPDKLRKNIEIRRERMKGGLTATEVKAWAREQVKVCRWCKADCSEKYHVDHIMPLAKGGPHERHNLCIACPPCNLSKRDKDPLEFELKISIDKSADVG